MTVIILSTTSALSQTWNVPADWNNSQNTIEMIGGGGAGSSGTESLGNNGGGGGAYATKSNVTLTPGGTTPFFIGVAAAGGTGAGASGSDTWFISNSTVLAKAGTGGTDSLTNAPGGAAASCIPSTGAFSGGQGGTNGAGTNNSGVGGGGAAGPSGTGRAGADNSATGNNSGTGGGGGAANSATAGVTSGASAGGAGGKAQDNTAGGTGGAQAGATNPGGAGSHGSGGGGAGARTNAGTAGAGGQGGAGIEWTTAGAGGGGGGGGGRTSGVAGVTGGKGGAGGLYGAGGGSGGFATTAVGNGGDGASGVIVITYTPLGNNWLPKYPDKLNSITRRNPGSQTDALGVFNSENTNLDKWKSTFTDRAVKYIYRNSGSRDSYLLPIPRPAAPALSGWLTDFPNISRSRLKLFLSRLNGIIGSTGTGTGGNPYTPPSSGPLRFIFTGSSQTVGIVPAFSDGTINVPLLNISAQFPLVRACIEILAHAGAAAKPYKLQVIRNGTTLFSLRSVIWGTIMATPTDPAYQIIDRQLQATSNPLL